jgi:ABC-type glycerol-3-phosphate transport system substrate-binding protein
LRKLHLTLLPALLLALALGLAACGGGGESDEDKIVETIETSATSSDPADCEALATQKFMEQTEAVKGSKAVKSCEEEAEDTEGDPESVDVSKVAVDGSQATADAAFNGGNFDGQTLSVALVEEGGDWKLDEVTGFAKFDQDKLVASFEKLFGSGEEPLEPQVVTCIGEVFGELSKPEFEELLFGGSQQPLIEIAEGCQQEQQ